MDALGRGLSYPEYNHSTEWFFIASISPRCLQVASQFYEGQQKNVNNK